MVGLITSDGSLSKDGRHIDITSKERPFLNKIKKATGITNKIGMKRGLSGKTAFHIQIGNKNFYDFLLSIGLTPNKSLTIGSIKVSERYFVDFLRGLIDGDGCIRRWIHPSNHGEQWSLRIYSGSEKFLSWLKDRVACILRANGKTYYNSTDSWTLKFGKMAARKIKLAGRCVVSYRGWSKSKTIVPDKTD